MACSSQGTMLTRPLAMRNPVTTFLLVVLLAVPARSLGTASLRRGKSAQKAEATSSVDVYYVTRIADKFASYTSKRKEAMEELHETEMSRLEEALEAAPNEKDKSLLETAATVNELSRLESLNAFHEMQNFVSTLKQAMGARGSVIACNELSCGLHAFCSQSIYTGAECLCQDGYDGDGFVCSPRQHFAPQILLGHVSPTSQVADLHVTAFAGNKLGLVFRHISDLHRGYLMMATASVNSFNWSAPIRFSNESQAYNPVIVELPGEGRMFAISYRDQNKGGNGVMLSGQYGGEEGMRLGVRLSQSKVFSRHQAQATAMLPLADGKFLVFFSEHLLSKGQTSGGAMYGSAVMGQASALLQAPEILVKRRFAIGAVTRISAAALTPTSFIVAYRGGEESSGQRSEAACLFGQYKSSELVFSQHSLSIEPHQAQIWARSIVALDDSVFAYTYHVGGDQVTKRALVKVDDITHKLHVVAGPEVIARGFTSFVGSASTLRTPFAANMSKEVQLRQSSVQHRLFTYMSGADSASGKAIICKVAASELGSCEVKTWAHQTLMSATTAALDDGRMVMAFTNDKGKPYFQLVGLDTVD